MNASINVLTHDSLHRAFRNPSNMHAQPLKGQGCLLLFHYYEPCHEKTCLQQVARQRTIKALIRLHGCAGLSAPLLFVYGIKRFSHDVSHILCVRTVKALARQRKCAGLPEPSLFPYVIPFSQELAQI